MDKTFNSATRAETSIEPGLIAKLGKRTSSRANARRGQIDPQHRSYLPVESVRKALMVLHAANTQRISTISSLHQQTGIPKPTIVRMLETLIHEGYVVRDNMCGGYRVTSHSAKLNAGYAGISRMIEVARPIAVDLTQRIKWPSGLGMIERDTINIHFWTGSISPLTYTNTILGHTADILTSAMGRAFLAFCTPAEREARLSKLRDDPLRTFDAKEERALLMLLERVRQNGYAMRDPQTRPDRITTLAVPLVEKGKVQAMMSVSLFKSAIPRSDIAKQIVEPLLESRSRIEQSMACLAHRVDSIAGYEIQDII